MKKWLALIFVVLVLLLSACVNTSVTYKLTENNTVGVDYRMDFTPGDEDISSYTKKLTGYWESMGFTAKTTEADGVSSLQGTKTVECGDMNEAVKALAEIFTDDDSLLYDVEFLYEPSYFQDDFSLKASVSLEDILRQSESGALPPAAAQSLLDEAAKCQYTLSIALPGKVVSTNADSQDNGLCIWNLKYGETTPIELSTSHVFSDNVEYYGTLQNALSRDNLLMIILGAVAGLALIGVILVLVIRARKKRAALAAPAIPAADQHVPPTDQAF